MLSRHQSDDVEWVTILNLVPEFRKRTNPRIIKIELPEHPFDLLVISNLFFKNHKQFHYVAIRVAIAGPMGALVSTLFPGGPSLSVVMAAAAIVAAVTMSSERHTHLRMLSAAVPMAIAGACLLLGSEWNSVYIAPLLFALFAAVPIAAGARTLPTSILVAAGAFLFAHTVILQMVTSVQLAPLPSWLRTTALGFPMSAAGVLALLPRHIRITSTSVNRAYSELIGNMQGEIKELVQRSKALWQNANAHASGDVDTHLQILEQAVLRLMETAKRWSDADILYVQTDAASVSQRIQDFEQRMTCSEDNVVITQYKLAQNALLSQRKYIEEINRNRDRVLARMHNYLAAMERMSMALVTLRSTSVSRDAADLTTVVEDLQELGQDIDSYNLALDLPIPTPPAHLQYEPAVVS